MLQVYVNFWALLYLSTYLANKADYDNSVCMLTIDILLESITQVTFSLCSFVYLFWNGIFVFFKEFRVLK